MSASTKPKFASDKPTVAEPAATATTREHAPIELENFLPYRLSILSNTVSQAIADDLCSAAQLVMGESDEAAPFVVIRGLDEGLIKGSEYPTGRFAVKPDQCVYMRSLGYRPRRTSLRASSHPS